MSSSEDVTLFDVLNNVAEKNYFISSHLSTEQKKQFHPYVLLNWMFHSGVDPIRLQTVNNGFFAHDGDTQLALLATVEKKPTKRRWVWCKSNSVESDQQAIDQLQYEFDMDASTARSVLSILTEQEYSELITSYADRNRKETSRNEKKASRR